MATVLSSRAHFPPSAYAEAINAHQRRSSLSSSLSASQPGSPNNTPPPIPPRPLLKRAIIQHYTSSPSTSPNTSPTLQSRTISPVPVPISPALQPYTLSSHVTTTISSPSTSPQLQAQARTLLDTTHSSASVSASASASAPIATFIVPTKQVQLDKSPQLQAECNGNGNGTVVTVSPSTSTSTSTLVPPRLTLASIPSPTLSSRSSPSTITPTHDSIYPRLDTPHPRHQPSAPSLELTEANIAHHDTHMLHPPSEITRGESNVSTETTVLPAYIPQHNMNQIVEKMTNNVNKIIENVNNIMYINDNNINNNCTTTLPDTNIITNMNVSDTIINNNHTKILPDTKTTSPDTKIEIVVVPTPTTTPPPYNPQATLHDTLAQALKDPKHAKQHYMRQLNTLIGHEITCDWDVDVIKHSFIDEEMPNMDILFTEYLRIFVAFISNILDDILIGDELLEQWTHPHLTFTVFPTSIPRALSYHHSTHNDHHGIRITSDGALDLFTTASSFGKHMEDIMDLDIVDMLSYGPCPLSLRIEMRETQAERDKLVAHLQTLMSTPTPRVTLSMDNLPSLWAASHHSLDLKVLNLYAYHLARNLDSIFANPTHAQVFEKAWHTRTIRYLIVESMSDVVVDTTTLNTWFIHNGYHGVWMMEGILTIVIDVEKLGARVKYMEQLKLVKEV